MHEVFEGRQLEGGRWDEGERIRPLVRVDVANTYAPKRSFDFRGAVPYRLCVCVLLFFRPVHGACVKTESLH